MPAETALDADLQQAIGRIGTAELVVGIPSYRNAATIGHVVATAARGLRDHFPGARVAIVNADGGSDDGTPERVRASAAELPLAAGRYLGASGKGSAFRAIFECAVALDARACAVVDADLRSITPEWIARLLGPVVRAEADYIAPLYARHKHDGTITNTVAYPLTRALYGLRVRQPIGGEFGFHTDLARGFLAEPGWDGDIARFGIDIFMTTTAIVRHARIAQAFLGAKIHDPKDPAADLGPMFTQVVGTLLRLAVRNKAAWRDVTGSHEVPILGEVVPVEPEAIPADPARLRERSAAGAASERALWDEVLTTAPPATMGAEAWAGVVFDFLEAALRGPHEPERLARGLLPLYYARVAELVDEVRGLDTAAAEEVVELGARAMEMVKLDRLEAMNASDA